MPRNLEIKAKLHDREAVLAVLGGISARAAAEMTQTDTYFNVPKGRLKLREFGGGPAELISYQRSENSDQRQSIFHIYRSGDPSNLKNILEKSLGIRAVVKKRRMLFLYGTTRIHIDEVENLGDFIEFEVPSEAAEEEAKRTMNFLLEKFRIAPEDLIRGSYVDMISGADRRSENPSTIPTDEGGKSSSS